ncbi:MAG: hypothetical protein J5733_10315, partial [Bacteroidaceae bacterium]|nr:hypothetical protein [Bacteroidaceae bacterium]
CRTGADIAGIICKNNKPKQRYKWSRIIQFGKAARICLPRASDVDPFRQNLIDPLHQNKNTPLKRLFFGGYLLFFETVLTGGLTISIRAK